VAESTRRGEAPDPQEKRTVLPPAAKAAAAKEAAEREAKRRAAAARADNPTWWAPVFVTLLLVGLAWIVVFYVSQGLWPIVAFGYWNLVIGFGLLIAGFLMTMRWR
jgi:hypothetical protein